MTAYIVLMKHHSREDSIHDSWEQYPTREEAVDYVEKERERSQGSSYKLIHATLIGPVEIEEL